MVTLHQGRKKELLYLERWPQKSKNLMRCQGRVQSNQSDDYASRRKGDGAYVHTPRRSGLTSGSPDLDFHSTVYMHTKTIFMF